MSNTSELRLPDFLIIGAMKAGTTTIFKDLQSQEQIFFPVHKEPHHLCRGAVLTDEGLAKYAELFRMARPDQLCGDASTGYSKIPVYENVPQRALQVLGPDLRILYSVREPVARMRSHHFHLYLVEGASSSFEDVLRQLPDLINFSKYAMQIAPWIETFGRQQVHIVQLEDYAADRRKGLHELCAFLGIDAQPERMQPDVIFRAGKDGRKTPSWMVRPLQKVLRSRWYRYALRPILPDGTVKQLKKLFLNRPSEHVEPPRAAIIDQIVDAVRDDAEQLRQIMGRDKPLWDFDAVRAKYVSAENKIRTGV